MRYACSGRPGDHVAPADGELLVPEETRSLAVEDDEELFLRRVAMRRTVELARPDDRVVESCPNRARGPAELPKRVAELPRSSSSGSTSSTLTIRAGLALGGGRWGRRD